MTMKGLRAICIAVLWPYVCLASAQELKTVEGGALYLTRAGVETHRAEFVFAADCEHVARILNQAEPLVDWHCSTSVPDIVMDCEINGVTLDTDAPAGLQLPKSLPFFLVLNRGAARGSSELGAPLGFTYAESGANYLLTSDYPYAAGNSFTRAVYLLIIDSAAGTVEVRDIGGKSNGAGHCKLAER